MAEGAAFAARLLALAPPLTLLKAQPLTLLKAQPRAAGGIPELGAGELGHALAERGLRPESQLRAG